MKTSIWEPDRLDRELRRRRANRDTPTNGTMRSMLQGGGPSWTTLSNVQLGCPIADVMFWGNHPVFHMLECGEHDANFGAVMTYAIDSVWGQVRERFWPWAQTGTEPGSANPVLEILQDSAVVAAVLDDHVGIDALSHLDCFVLYMACYFMAKRARQTALAERAAQGTCWAFAAAALGQPQLLVAWRDLQQAVAARIWDVEGITLRHGPVLADPNNAIGAHVRRLFPSQLVALAEDNEDIAIAK